MKVLKCDICRADAKSVKMDDILGHVALPGNNHRNLIFHVDTESELCARCVNKINDTLVSTVRMLAKS